MTFLDNYEQIIIVAIWDSLNHYLASKMMTSKN